MGIAANRRKMMVWMIEQLEARGYKELNRNGLIDDNFKKLSQALLSVSEIEAKPSIEEIINDIKSDNKKEKLGLLILDVKGNYYKDKEKFKKKI